MHQPPSEEWINSFFYICPSKYGCPFAKEEMTENCHDGIISHHLDQPINHQSMARCIARIKSYHNRIHRVVRSDRSRIRIRLATCSDEGHRERKLQLTLLSPLGARERIRM